MLGVVFALATVGLVFELVTNPRHARTGRPEERSRGFVADYAAVLSNRWARDRHPRGLDRGGDRLGRLRLCGRRPATCASGLSFTAVGLIVGTFAIGGLIYVGLDRSSSSTGSASAASRIGGGLLCASPI